MITICEVAIADGKHFSNTLFAPKLIVQSWLFKSWYNKQHLEVNSKRINRMSIT
jgi:hypothetical protein